MNKCYCTAGRIELTKEQAFSTYNAKRYIVTSYGIFQPFFSSAQNAVYFAKISEIKGIVKRGRHETMTGEEINNILGFAYLLNL